MLAPYFETALNGAQPAWRRVVAQAMLAGVPVPAMLASLAAITATPAPGNVTLLVDANSYTMSALPYFSHRLRISGKGTNSPSNSWMQ